MALHHTIVQQVARTSIGERSAFKLYSIHLVDETMWAQSTADSRDREIKREGGKSFSGHNLHHLPPSYNQRC